MGHGPGDELGPVCAPEQRPQLRGAASRALAEANAQLFLGEQLPGGYDWSTGLDGKLVRWEASPVIRARDGGWEACVASRSANFREQVRARERRLRRRHEVAYRRTDDPARLRADLELLFALHRARWPAGLPRSGRSLSISSSPGQPSNAAGCGSGSSSSMGAQSRRGTDFASGTSRSSTSRAGIRGGSASRSGSCSSRTRSGTRSTAGCASTGCRGDEPYKYRFADAGPGVAPVATGRGVLGNAIVAAGAARYRHARRSTRALQATRLE